MALPDYNPEIFNPDTVFVTPIINWAYSTIGSSAEETIIWLRIETKFIVEDINIDMFNFIDPTQKEFEYKIYDSLGYVTHTKESGVLDVGVHYIAVVQPPSITISYKITGTSTSKVSTLASSPKIEVFPTIEAGKTFSHIGSNIVVLGGINRGNKQSISYLIDRPNKNMPVSQPTITTNDKPVESKVVAVPIIKHLGMSHETQYPRGDIAQYTVYGIIRIDGVRAPNKTLRLYDRKSGELISETVSDANGDWSFAAKVDESKDYYVIAFDDMNMPLLQAIISDKVKAS